MRFDYSPFFRSTVGFDHLFDLLESASETAQGYPPYNIERSDETHYRVTVAVAGFGEKDLNVEVKDDVLTVTGRRETEAG
jgi:molecular chaperone IbpA